jgi:hypothetical protein
VSGELTPEEIAEWLRKVPADVLARVSAAASPAPERPRYRPARLRRRERKARQLNRAYWRWRASFPHDPMWNLIPRRAEIPYECDWHGATVTGGCPECAREHREYLETGTWEDRRAVPSPEEVAAADGLTALTEELGLYDDGPDCG